MSVKINLRDYCYDCKKSKLFVLNVKEGQQVYCENDAFCDQLITRLRLTNLEKSVDELKEKENA